MGEMRIIKIADAAFEGDDKQEVTGKYVYVVPAKGSVGQPERLFISDDRLAKMEYKPIKGDTVYVFRTQRGGVQELIKV